MRIARVLLVTTALLLAAPATATADVIFDPADADDLAAVLADAYADQTVCYGWDVSVSDPISGTSQSVGSNFGAGEPVRYRSCEATVTFRADITYTSESSEAEDSASYDVSSNPAGVTRADLDALGIDFGGLTGEDPDVPIGQAVTALPLLAADAGIAKPISAAPATGQAPADAQLTDNPNSDWWRNQGGMVMWALIVIAAGGVFAWWVLRSERRKRARRRRRGYPQAASVPPYQPSTPEPEPPTEELPVQARPATEPPTEELPVQEPVATEPATEEPPAQEPAEAEPPAAEKDSAEAPATDEKVATEEPATDEKVVTAEPAAEETAAADEAADPEPGTPEQARPAPSDQKDKE